MQRLFVMVLLAASCLGVQADVLVGRVVGVSDGDTVTVLDGDRVQHKVRLAGIDAPESHQAYGGRSKQHLSSLVFSQDVQVEWHKLDRYGRLVGKILVGGVDANLRQVEAGLAWHYQQYHREQSPADREAYASAERRARDARFGLWADAAPVPPWDFRRSPGVSP